MRLESPPLSITFLLAAMVAWGGIALAVVSGSREPPDMAKAEPVAERFGDWEAHEPLLKKTDRIVGPVTTTPVQTAPVRVAQAEPKPRAASKQAEPKKTRKVERNVCTRHGMRKMTTRGGKSWRCRR